MICEKIEHFRYTCTPDEAARLVAYLLKCGFWFKVETSDGVKVECGVPAANIKYALPDLTIGRAA
jgi:hypothetical protein